MRKTKTIYLIIGSTLLLLVLIVFIFLLVQAFNSKDIPSTATIDQTEPRYTNEYKVTEPETVTLSTETPTENVLIVDKIIKVKGLYVDKSGNVYDSDKNKYSKSDGYIAIVFEGEVYKISVKYIEKVNLKAKEEEKTKATQRSDKKEDKKQSVSQSNNSQSNSGNVSVSQSPNVSSKPNQKPQTQNSNVRLSTTSLTVPLGTSFWLTLQNAGSDVNWSSDANALSFNGNVGNQANFTAIRKGATTIVAHHSGKSYCCTITVV